MPTHALPASVPASRRPARGLPRRAAPALLAGAALLLAGCTTIEDCGGALGNKDEPRIRSSTVRMLLADPAAASARFSPYAAMAALVYEEAPDCRHALPPVAHKDALLRLLADAGWKPFTPGPQPRCDDDIGTFFRVWTREHADHVEAVLVFRGTKGGARDWITGNLRWFTRFLPGDDQYDRSRAYGRDVIAELRRSHRDPARPLRIYTAGHSLGGGLAQNVLYAFPTDVLQAYAFNPSPVTGYADNDDATRRDGCNCRDDALGGEARVYRIYETDEVLAWLRYPLKLALPLNRHIQEVRFNFGDGHSMSGLAKGMADAARGRPPGERGPWWRGKPAGDGRNCTAAFDAAIRSTCALSNSGYVCPP
jgi:hypothetical protein